MNALGALTGATLGGCGSRPRALAAQGAVSAMFAREVSRQKGDVEIRTAEGDRVSIRFRSRDAVTLASAQSTGAEGTDSASRVTVLSRGRVQVEVAGNLNPDELAAIANLLDQIDALATQFFGGDVQAAFDAAANIGFDSAQIAGFSVDLTYSRKLVAAIASSGSPVPAAPAANDSAPPTAGAPAENPAPAQPASAGDSPAPASLRETVLGFVHDVIAGLATVTGTSQLKFSMSWKLSLFIQALSNHAAPPDAADSAGNSPGAQLLGDTLQRLAA